jgi:hypothetical protein
LPGAIPEVTAKRIPKVRNRRTKIVFIARLNMIAIKFGLLIEMDLRTIFMACPFEHLAIKGHRQASKETTEPFVDGLINGLGIAGLKQASNRWFTGRLITVRVFDKAAELTF